MNSWHSPQGRSDNDHPEYFLQDEELVDVNNGENTLLSVDANVASSSASTVLHTYRERSDSSSGVVFEENDDAGEDSCASTGENVIMLAHQRVVNGCDVRVIEAQGVNASLVEIPLEESSVKSVPCGIKAINAKKCGLHASYFICSSEGCISTSKNHLLYPFPKTPRIALSWLQRCGRENLVHHLGVNGSVPNNFLLCEKHFDDDQFVEDTDPKELKKVAMPTLFLTSKPNVEERNSAVKSAHLQEKRLQPPREDFYVSSEESFPSPSKCCDITFVTEYGTVEIDSALPKIAAVSLTRLKPSTFTLEFCVENDLGLKCAQFCKSAISELGITRPPPHPAAERASCIQRLAAQQRHDLATVSQVYVHVSPQFRKKRGYVRPGPSSSKVKIKSSKQAFPSSAEMQRKYCADSLCSSDKDAVLFLFPISEDLCRAWMENIGDPGLLHLSRKHGYHCWHKAMTLCSDHFQPNCYQARRGRLRLVPNAVPTIFSHGLLSHPCRYVGRKPSVQDIQCGHDSCLAVAKKPWQSVEEANYLKKRKRWIERMKTLADEASDEEDDSQHRKRNTEDPNRNRKSPFEDRHSEENDNNNYINSDESDSNLLNGNSVRLKAERPVDSTCNDDDLKPVFDDPIVMKRAIKRFCDEQELQVCKRQKVEPSRFPVVSSYVPRTTKSRSRYPLREEAEKKIDLKQLSEVDSEVKYLRKQLNILNTEHVRLKSAVFRASKNVRMEARMPLSLFYTPKDAFESFKDKLDVFTYGFIHQQQTHYSRPHWDPRSAKIPILMSHCSVQVWAVLQSLFKLPCKPSLFKYKAAARKDPSIFDNSALMNEFVQKSYKSRFKRAKPRQYVRKNSLTGMTVSDVLENYLKKQDIVPEV